MVDLRVRMRAMGGRNFRQHTSAIIARGAGLMAGSPGGIGRPALVTVPTPSPALNRVPLPWRQTAGPVARIWAPWVTSGSSPASFMMPTVAKSSARAGSSSGKTRFFALGQGNRPRNLANFPVKRAVKRPPLWPPWRNSRWSSLAAIRPPAALQACSGGRIGLFVAHDAILGAHVFCWLVRAGRLR